MQVKEGDLHLRKIVGIDLDAAAVRRAAKRICTRNPGIFEGEAAPELELFQADVACEAASSPGSLPCLTPSMAESLACGFWEALLHADGWCTPPHKEMRRIALLLF